MELNFKKIMGRITLDGKKSLKSFKNLIGKTFAFVLTLSDKKNKEI